MTDSPPRLSRKVAPLVKEFQQGVPGLSEADAYKSAFAVLALSKGWSKAKIGRYLGITRARVGQKIQKCAQYAENGNMPTLQRLLGEAQADRPDAGADIAVAFDRTQWDDPEFRVGMLNKLA